MAMPTSPEIIELERVASIIINVHQAAHKFEDLSNVTLQKCRYITDPVGFHNTLDRYELLLSVANNLMRNFESLVSYEYKFYNPAYLTIITDIRKELLTAKMHYLDAGFGELISENELQILLLWIDKEFKEYYADIINRISCAF